MAPESPQTIGGLRDAGIITNAEITAAVETYLTDTKAPPFEFASGHILNVAAAVHSHRRARAVMSERMASTVLRRTMTRTAVILAVPTRA